MVPQKVWICLFTCAVTRAVHLEVIPSLSTFHFLICFRRHVALNGRPSLVISDNAKQFVAARETVDRVWAEVCNDPSVVQYSQSEGIVWKFVVQYAPWMGGFYERMVGIVKRGLKVALDRKKLSLEELGVLAYEIATIVNRRPLVYLEEDEEPLTPSRLIARNRPLLPPIPNNQDPEYLSQARTAKSLILHWKRLQARLDEFWKCWKTSYLQGLQERRIQSQTGASREFPKPGVPVLVHDEMLPRSQWKVGVIDQMLSSADGLHRSAVIRLPGNKTSRTLKKLFPLESSVNDGVTTDALEETEGLHNTASNTRPVLRQTRPQCASARASRTLTRQMLNAEESEDEGN